MQSMEVEMDIFGIHFINHRGKEGKKWQEEGIIMSEDQLGR